MKPITLIPSQINLNPHKLAYLLSSFLLYAISFPAQARQPIVISDIQLVTQVQDSSDSTEIIPLEWINFSPYTQPGQNPNHNSVIPESQIIALLDSIRPYTKGIRTFGTQNGLEHAPRLAKERGLNVIVGIWIGRNDSINQIQIANGIAIAKAGYADRLIVGSEALYFRLTSPEQLIAYIQQVKDSCPDIPVSTADVYSALIAHPEVLEVCDFIAPNIYPFWEGIEVECAMQRFHQAYLSVLAVADGKEIFISESGWKTGGAAQGEAIPSLEHAIQYNRELLAWAQALDIEVNIFEAFDEPWKQPNDDGWGVFNNQGSLKPGMDTLFKPFDTIDSTWLCKAHDSIGSDTLIIDYLPPIGSFSFVEGHSDPQISCDYVIATYIKVRNGWWTKPTFAQPAVPILCNGKWRVDYTTGGSDRQASEICIFLIPATYDPPRSSGRSSIPSDIYQHALSWKCIQRYQLDTVEVVTSADTICSGDSVRLTASGGTNYRWSTGEMTPSVQVAPLWTQSYKVEITDGMGGGAILSKTIVVLRPPYARVIAFPTYVCAGESSTLTVLGDGTYLWSTGDTTESIVVVPDTTTSYAVTVTDSLGCASTVSREINVKPLPSIAISGELNICQGESTRLTASGGIGYEWSSGERTPNITIAPDETTTYTVTSRGSNGCEHTVSETVVVHPLPEVALDGARDTFYNGYTDSIFYMGIPRGGYYSFPNIDTVESDTVFNPAKLPAGTHLLKYTYTDPLTGCTHSDSVEIIIMDGVYVGIDDTHYPSVTLFPNPSHGEVWIVFDQMPDQVHYRIVDAMGRLISTGQSRSKEIHLYGLPRGIFLLTLSGRNLFVTKKIKVD